MRTVDPEQWSRKLQKRPMAVARPWRYSITEITALERRLRSSLADAMLELMRNCSVEGVAAILDRRNTKPVRWFYLVLVVGTIVWSLAVLSFNVGRLSSLPPLTVVLQAERQPVQQVDFPAVALCSYNTISDAALDAYAEYLFSLNYSALTVPNKANRGLVGRFNPCTNLLHACLYKRLHSYSLERNNTYSIESLKSNLLAFSGLIAQASQVKFDANFTRYLAETVRQTNITHIIYKLSPKCESILQRCSWRAQRMRCDRLFAKRITDVGYCCVFNARYSPEDRANPPYRVNIAEQDSGLSVVVKENTDDFTYVRRTGEELEMLLFDGNQYPLMKAGVVRTYPIQRNASAYVALRAVVQRASPSLRYYSEAWRGCAIRNSDGVYEQAWSNCVAECRRRAVLAVCLCTPHTKPIQYRRADEATCSLEHLTCLDKHKEKLSSFYPGEKAHESLSEEQADSVECLHCRPNCARQLYSTHVQTLRYNSSFVRKALFSKFVQGLHLENASVIRIYFTHADQKLLLVETNIRFYEVIAYISSQWVLLAGVTVVFALEVLYHCTVRWHHHYRRRWRRHTLPPLMPPMTRNGGVCAGGAVPLHRALAPPLPAASAASHYHR